jgi:hypothetical protein
MNTISTSAGPILSALMQQLKKQKYRPEFLESVVPSWWTADVESDSGAVAHLKLILARTLGLDTKALLKANKVLPVTPSGMQFKRSVDLQKSAPPSPNLAYYSRLVKAVASCMEPSLTLPTDPHKMHEEILSESDEGFVSLNGIVNYCWQRNIAVIHVDNVPVGKKGFDALVYPYDGRYVIILARKIGYEAAARASFIIAHELGHIAMGHVEQNCALIDDPANRSDRKKEYEPAADAFASAVLSGGRYSKKWRGRALRPDLLAQRAEEYGSEFGIDPGHLLLRYAWEDDANGSPQKALFLLSETLDCDVHAYVNDIARKHIQTDPISKDARALLDRSLKAA